MASRTRRAPRPVPPVEVDKLIDTLPDLRIEASAVAQVEAISDLISERLAAMKGNHPDRPAIETAWLNARRAGEHMAEARRLSQQAQQYMANADSALERTGRGG